MANFNLYVDIAANALVTSDSDSTAAPLPPLVQGDTPTLNIYLLAKNPLAFQSGQSLYTIINNAGLTLHVVIGEKVGNNTDLYTSQYVWTPDAQNKFFSATLPLNTAAITTLIGGAAQSPAPGPTYGGPVTFEVKYLQAGVPSTVLEVPCIIAAAVDKGAGVGPVPPGQTPASVEYVNATFLTRRIQGQIILVSADGTKQAALYVDNDGTAHLDPLS